jgi:predicted nucleic acid-binding protein
MRYWDTSALLKLYVSEPDSVRFRSHATAKGPLLTADISRCELFTALERKEFAGAITPATAPVFYSQFENDISAGRIVILRSDERERQRFQSLVRQLYHWTPPILIRTLDAIHISAALAANASEFVTTDQRQAEAVSVFHLPVIS